MPIDPRDPVHTGTASRGLSYLYVVPLVVEDQLKLGFSRDPLQRLASLHARWFEVFDLDRVLLVETETVRDARTLELRLRRQLAEHNAPAPMTMQEAAGGLTEWYRGAYDVVASEMRACGAAGYTVFDPARAWLRDALLGRSDRLHDWSLAALTVDDFDAPQVTSARHRIVRDTLDAYAALDIDLVPLLPTSTLDWHHAVRGR